MSPGGVLQSLPLIAAEIWIANLLCLTPPMIGSLSPASGQARSPRNGPAVILKQSAISESACSLRTFSIAARAGFLGMRMFRDNPDVLVVNPRMDLRATTGTMPSQG